MERERECGLGGKREFDGRRELNTAHSNNKKQLSVHFCWREREIDRERERES
jgi:hypothetical protein